EAIAALLRSENVKFRELAGELAVLLYAFIEMQRSLLKARDLSGGGWTYGASEALAAIDLHRYLERLESARVTDPLGAAAHLMDLWGLFLEEGMSPETAASLAQSQRASRKRRPKLTRRAVQIAWDKGHRTPDKVANFLRN